MYKKNNKEQGFTLLEVIIATFLLTVGIGGAFLLSARITQSSSLPESRLVATYLAQECLEVARNIRDTNYLRISTGAGGNWDDNLTGCAAGCECVYSESTLLPYLDRFLSLDTASSVFNYGIGNATPYKRRISVIPNGSDQVEVVVEVLWDEKGKSYAVTAATEFYDWLVP